MFKIKFDHVISLGANCGCAMYLKRHHLRAASYPFDWLGGSSLVKRAYMIVNNFDNFMQYDALRFMEVSPDPIHDIWEEVTNGITYAHDFEKGGVLEEMFPAVRAKYDRRIKRFYRSIRESSRVLLVYWSRNSVVSTEDALEVQQVLSRFFGKELYLLVVQNEKGTEPYRETVLSDYVRMCHVDFHMEKYTVAPGITIGDTEMSDPIFARIRCAGKFKRCCRYWVVKSCAAIRASRFMLVFSRILCTFVPGRERRRALRDALRGK